jgi:hypothetical protein
VKLPEELQVVQNEPPKRKAELPNSLMIECIEMDGEVVGRVLMMGYDGLLNANQSMSSI